MKTIETTDIGPVEQLTIPIKLGVVVLRGPNDCGKSTTLDAVSKVVGGDGTVTCRDKAARGTIEGLGITVSVKRSPRRTGELEAIDLDGKLSIADIADPPIKDPEAADLQRIKGLVRVSGVKLTAEDFLDVVPEGVVLSEATLQTKDPVTLAKRIKREIEVHARGAADNAAKEKQAAEVCRKAAEGVDVDGPCDSEQLQTALEKAIGVEGSVTEQRVAAIKAADNVLGAKKRLAEAEAAYTGPTAGDADAAYRNATQNYDDRLAELEHAQEGVVAANQMVASATATARQLQSEWKASKDHEEAMSGWREAIDQTVPDLPRQEQIDAASNAVTEAREAVENGAIIRRTQSQLADADIHDVATKRHTKAAEALRNAARATDDVLSAAVSSDAMTVKAGRLVTVVEGRGEVFFADRSDGIRWKLAIDEAVARIKADGAEGTAVIPVPQVAWEGIDPDNRQLVHEHAVKCGVTIITAEAARGELRAEEFTETE